MQIDEEEFGAVIELLGIHANVLSKLVDENHKMKEQIKELYKDRCKDKLIVRAAILSIVGSLSNKRMLDFNQFISAFKSNIIADKPTFDELGIDIDEILIGGGPIPSPTPQPKNQKSKHKAKVKDGVIDFQDFKKGN